MLPCAIPKKYLDDKAKIIDQLCLAYRKPEMRGHNTNNFSEINVRLFKDYVLQRTKAYNDVALIDFVCVKFAPHASIKPAGLSIAQLPNLSESSLAGGLWERALSKRVLINSFYGFLIWLTCVVGFFFVSYAQSIPCKHYEFVGWFCYVRVMATGVMQAFLLFSVKTCCH